MALPTPEFMTTTANLIDGHSFAIAIEHARELGGNALIALRCDATGITSGVSEVLCYGTAVRIVPERDADSA